MNDWTSPVDIRPDHLGMVQDILREHLPAGIKVWVFGSRANWTTKDSSDLDLAVEGAGILDYKAMVGLEVALEESDLPYTVDVVDLNAVSYEFKKIVEEQRIPFPSKGRQAKVGGDWDEVTLGKVVDIVMGQSPSGDTVSTEWGIALLNGPTEFGAHHPTPVQFTTDARKRAQPGDILFCVRGSTTGRMNWADQEYAIGRGVAAIRHREQPALQPFVRGVIELELPALLSRATGSTFPNVSVSQLAEIPYPSLDKQEQYAIAHILGTLDDKIELNRRMNQTLEEMVRAIFQDWFVDFSPVRAKLEGREPYLPSELWDLFPDRLVDSELGEIPDGWQVKMLEEFATVVYGAPFSSKRFNESGYGLPLIRIRDLATHDPSVFTDEQHLKGELINPGDIVVGMDGEFRAHIWKGPTSWLNQRVCHFKPRRGVPRTFLFEALTGPLSDFERVKVGTTVIHLGKTDIDSIKLVWPSSGVFVAFSTLAEPLVDQVVANAAESDTLAAQRDVLLPKLVFGGGADPEFLRTVGRYTRWP